MRSAPQTYAVTLVCAGRMRLFQRAANAELFLATVFRYRDAGRLLLHGFVVMPDHVHLLFSPGASLEQTVGLVKGGYSFAVRQRYKGGVWQEGYYSHRVRDEQDFASQREYIARNPERRRYEAYPYVYTNHGALLDPMPSHLAVYLGG